MREKTARVEVTKPNLICSYFPVFAILIN